MSSVVVMLLAVAIGALLVTAGLMAAITPVAARRRCRWPAFFVGGGEVGECVGGLFALVGGG